MGCSPISLTANDGVGSVVDTADDGKKLQASFDDSPTHVRVTVELKPNRGHGYRRATGKPIGNVERATSAAGGAAIGAAGLG
jgi:hypothetical protein